jgi:hypothetical protein
MKTLCELDKKEIEKNFAEVVKLVNKPKYVCRRCARAVNEKDLVCKPAKIPLEK